jgi:hypothetical protein
MDTKNNNSNITSSFSVGTDGKKVNVSAGVQGDYTHPIGNNGSEVTIEGGLGLNVAARKIGIDASFGVEGKTGNYVSAQVIDGQLQITQTQYTGNIGFKAPTKELLNFV